MRIFRSKHSGSVLAALTQAFGLLQMLLLVWPDADRQTDAYFYLMSWAQLPGSLILAGYAYPLWLSGLPGSAKRLKIAVLTAPAAALLGVSLAGVVFGSVTSPYPELPLHVLLFSALGSVLSVAWALGLRASANGDSRWVGALTLPANVLSCAVLVLTLGADTSIRISVALLAQMAGVTLMILLILRRAIRWSDLYAVQPHGLGRKTSTEWFLGQSVVAYASSLVLQTVAASLAPATLSVLGILTRVVSGVNIIISNTVLPRLINTNSSSSEPVIGFVRLMLWGAFPVGLSLAVASAVAFRNEQLAVAALGVAWLMAIVLGASFKRLAVRFLEPRASAPSMVLHAMVALLSCWLWAAGLQSLATVVLGLVLLDLLPGIWLASVLGRWRLATSATLCVLIIGSCAGLVLSMR